MIPSGSGWAAAQPAPASPALLQTIARCAEALEGLENTVEPATVGQEIWERKGWNRVESGWRGFF